MPTLITTGVRLDATVRGTVRVGSMDTPYVRAGAGTSVLLLLSGGAETIETAEIFRRLAREFRVLAPVLAPDPAHRPRRPADGSLLRLRDLVEVLGLETPHLVVQEGMEVLMQCAPEEEPGEFEAVLSVADGCVGENLRDLVALLRAAEVRRGVSSSQGQTDAPSRI